ncbi:head-tail connector protein [Rufibacter soli]
MEVTVLTDLTPAQEPVSLELAASYCKIDADMAGAEGILLSTLVTAARQWCEQYAGLSLGPKTLQVKTSRTGWQGPDRLPYGPNIKVTAAEDAEGNAVSLDQFGSLWYAEYLKGMSVNNTFKEDYGYFGAYADPAAFEEEYTVTYTAGFEESKVPAPIQLAILKTALELYNNRENTVIGTIVAELPQDAKALLNPYRAKVLF